MRRLGRRSWAWLVMALVGGVGLAGCAETVTDPPPTPSPAPASTTPQDPLERAGQAVVTVRAEGSAASGVVLTADGYVLTSDTVTAGGSMTVTLAGGESLEATLVGTDRRTQLAVVRLSGAAELLPASFAPQPAAAGTEVRSVSGPELPGGGPGEVLATDQLVGAVSVILTDAPADPGSAGGPVLDAAGAVVGLITGSIAPADGSAPTAIAVPADLAARVAEQLIDDGEVTHPYLGVSMEDTGGGGAQVREVVDGGPADRAGLRPGDVITGLGGRPVDGPGTVVAVVQAGAAGDELTVEYTRDGVSGEARVTLGEVPAG